MSNFNRKLFWFPTACMTPSVWVIPKKTSIQLWFLLLSMLQVTPDLRAERKPSSALSAGLNGRSLGLLLGSKWTRPTRFSCLCQIVSFLSHSCVHSAVKTLCVCTLIAVWYVGVNQRDRYLRVWKQMGGCRVDKKWCSFRNLQSASNEGFSSHSSVDSAVDLEASQGSCFQQDKAGYKEFSYCFGWQFQGHREKFYFFSQITRFSIKPILSPKKNPIFSLISFSQHSSCWICTTFPPEAIFSHSCASPSTAQFPSRQGF